MDNSPLAKLPPEVLQIIWELLFTPCSAATLRTFDCGHTEHGASDTSAKRPEIDLLKCSKELYQSGSMMLYGKRNFLFHEPSCFRQFVEKLSRPFLLQLANTVEVHIKRKYRKRPVSANTLRSEELQFVSDIEETLRYECGDKLRFTIDSVAHDICGYTSAGPYVRVIVTMDSTGVGLDESRWPKRARVKNISLDPWKSEKVQKWARIAAGEQE